MTRGEAINWLISIMSDIGKIEHQDLWHYEQALSEIKELLEAQPEVLACGEGELSAQPEIVRCKDCKFYLKLNIGSEVCVLLGSLVWKNPEFYCGFAERREE